MIYNLEEKEKLLNVLIKNNFVFVYIEGRGRDFRVEHLLDRTFVLLIILAIRRDITFEVLKRWGRTTTKFSG